MPLPTLNRDGDLPVGVHQATLHEVVDRFGAGTRRRVEISNRLTRIHLLAIATGKVERFLIFGSYVTGKPEPNDVDIVLVMQDDFTASSVSDDAKALFDHQRADAEFGASVFWVRPAMLINESVDEFIATWQRKRGTGRRGIVEVVT